MIDVHSTLEEQLLDVTVGQAVPQVPPHRHRDHLPRESETSERGTEDELMTPFSCQARSSNATVPSGLLGFYTRNGFKSTGVSGDLSLYMKGSTARRALAK